MYPTYKQLLISEPYENIFIGEMKINGRKSFNLNFIDDLTSFFMFVFSQENKLNENRVFAFKGEEGTGVFNMGGDLSLFLELVENKDILSLQQYGRKCVDLIYKSLKAKDSNMTTAALINGNALGGGFESTLACDIIIAEKDYKIQLPEIKLGFFPGMGAYELLNKRVGPKLTKEIIFSGKEYSTNELFELGVFDFLVEKGCSTEKLIEVIKKERKMQKTYNSLRKIIDREHSVDYSSLVHTIDLWVDSIISLSDNYKRKVERIITAQNNKFT
jgi:DSF synthase